MYDCLTAMDTYKIQKLQSSALRIVLYETKRAHISDMHRQLNVVSLEDRRHIHTIGQVFKCLHEMAPQSVCQQLQRVETGHGMAMRSSTKIKLALPALSLDTRRKSFKYRCPYFWNTLDDEIEDRGMGEL